MQPAGRGRQGDESARLRPRAPNVRGRGCMPNKVFRASGVIGTLCLLLAMLPTSISAQGSTTAGNPICEGEGVTYDPGDGQDIAVPAGYQVSVFARDLNFPTGIAFQGDANNFQVYVLESGTGLPDRKSTRLNSSHLP